jgi:hypothetical protein
MEFSVQLLTTFMECCALIFTRLVIYPKDVVLITGEAERTARNTLQKIRKALNKTKEMYVTIEEFCAYKGLNAEDVRRQLGK